jgi:hypothetical protein
MKKCDMFEYDEGCGVALDDGKMVRFDRRKQVHIVDVDITYSLVGDEVDDES